MRNSSLATYTNRTHNHSGRRTHPITKIAIHHMYAIWTAKRCVDYFANTTRAASCNYAVGYRGDIALGVDEANRAWTTSSAWCDNRAVTIEVANSSLGGNCPVSDAALEATIKLCTDICWRNDIYPCTFTGDTSGVLQMHKWYASTSCPGPYLGSKFSYIASEVTRRLDLLKGKPTPPQKPTPQPQQSQPQSHSGQLYKVTVDSLDIHQKAWSTSLVVGKITDRGTYTIVEQWGNWGKLKSGAGWIYLGSAKPAGQGSSPKHQSKSGTWKFNTAVNVRAGASTTHQIVALYRAGETVNILDTLETNGYAWGHYISHSGYHRYVALQPIGGSAYGKWV